MLAIFSQYRRVIYPLLLVLFFDLTLLASNFYLSAELEIASININMAGRQRMLSQRMPKSLMLMQYRISQQQSYEKEFKEMQDAVLLFDQTLNAFRFGGKATGTTGQEVYIEELSGEPVRKMLNEASAIWSPINEKILKEFSGKQFSEEQIKELIEELSANNVLLLKLMNDITNYLEEAAKSQTYYLRGLQAVVVLLILLSFITATVRLSRREHYYRQLMESGSDIILGINVQTGKTTFVSDSTSKILGHENDFYLNRSALNFFSETSRKSFSEILDKASYSNEIDNSRCEIELLKKDGDILTADMMMQLHQSEDGKYTELIADIRDISERKQYEQRLAQMAHTDALTGLANRKMFFDLAEHALSKANRQQSQCAIMFVDLDEFKQINDSYGHDAGDEVLKEVAIRLKNCVRSSDIVGRIGGDEFVVLIDDVKIKTEIEALAEKIIAAVSDKLIVFGEEKQVGASIGIAFYPEHGFDINTLINKADQSMYEIKNSGKGGVKLYTSYKKDKH